MRNQDAHNSAFRLRRRLITSALLTVLVVCFIFLISRIDLDGLLRFSNRLAAFPTIEADYGQIRDRVLSATNDVILRDNWSYHLELLRGKFYTGCIRGGFSRTYGTDRPFSDVLADYDKVFSRMGWRRGADSEITGGYFTKTAKIVLVVIDPTSLDYPTGNVTYQTIYRVSLTYADPALNSCQG